MVKPKYVISDILGFRRSGGLTKTIAVVDTKPSGMFEDDCDLLVAFLSRIGLNSFRQFTELTQSHATDHMVAILAASLHGDSKSLDQSKMNRAMEITTDFLSLFEESRSFFSRKNPNDTISDLIQLPILDFVPHNDCGLIIVDSKRMGVVWGAFEMDDRWFRLGDLRRYRARD